MKTILKIEVSETVKTNKHLLDQNMVAVISLLLPRIVVSQSKSMHYV